jgi:hypothetical protein
MKGSEDEGQREGMATPARWDSTMKPAGLFTEKSVTFSEAPAEALRTTGVKDALFRVEIATAEAPRKLAVLKIPPKRDKSN